MTTQTIAIRAQAQTIEAIRARAIANGTTPSEEIRAAMAAHASTEGDSPERKALREIKAVIERHGI